MKRYVSIMLALALVLAMCLCTVTAFAAEKSPLKFSSSISINGITSQHSTTIGNGSVTVANSTSGDAGLKIESNGLSLQIGSTNGSTSGASISTGSVSLSITTGNASATAQPVQSAKTADVGVLLYGIMGAASLLGTSVVVNEHKKH